MPRAISCRSKALFSMLSWLSFSSRATSCCLAFTRRLWASAMPWLAAGVPTPGRCGPATPGAALTPPAARLN
ncbi:MAG: hypothetical protein ACK56F_06465 [bacterium]